MDVQQTQTPLARQNARKHSKRRLLILVIILIALIVASIWALSSLELIPSFLAIIISAFAAVFAVAFALLPLIPAEHAPEPNLALSAMPEIKVEVISPIPSSLSSTPTQRWTVPYQRNPFFTGREDVLIHLHEHLTANNTTALTQSQAIHGLGGIGKTQVAIEYAYRYRDEYTYVLWLNAQSAESLLTEYVTLADLLHLPQPEKDEHYQSRLIAFIYQWFLQQDHWLLILDNADDLQAIHPFIPTGGKGHLIITTREYATGSLANLPIEKMSQEEGISFFLRRAKMLLPNASLATVSQQDRSQAEAIVKALDGLPLALDQAGAYLEETPSCSLSAYLERYHHQQRTFLDRRGRTSSHLSVKATFLLCFTQVIEQSERGANLLRCLAFLDPEDIPTAMLQKGAGELGPHLETITKDKALLDEAIGTLLRYSLVRYHPEKQACSIHRLVQAVLKEEMSPKERHQWKKRVVQAINQAFPASDVTTWQQCQRYLPHAQVCATWIEEEHLWFPEAGNLLYRIANYLYDRAFYPEAFPLCERALAIWEEVLGPKHPDTKTVRANDERLLEDMQSKKKQENRQRPDSKPNL